MVAKITQLWMMLIYVALCSTGALSLRGLRKDCFVLDMGMKTYTMENGTSLYNMGDDYGDNGYDLQIRREEDGLMTDGWFVPGKEYKVTLKNKMQMVGFNDYLMWLEPSTPEEESSRTGRVLRRKMTKKEKDILRFEQMRDKKKMKNMMSDSMYRGLYESKVGHWAHLPPVALLPGVVSTTGTTRDRLGCGGLVAERNVGMASRSLLSNAPRWERAIVKWKAPDSVSQNEEESKCVTISASVRTRGAHGSLYSNMGGLRKVLCPSYMRPTSAVLPYELMKNETDSEDGSTDNRRMKLHQNNGYVKDTMQPKDCCACGSATYKMTFQGVWSPDTHPKEWPHNKPSLLHWTNLIGASHMPSYSLYRMGEPASAAVQAICMYGDTTVMKQTLTMTAASPNGFSSVPTGSQRGSIGITPLLSLISAPGMWSYKTLMESRTVYFAVNRTHPVFTMLTMLGPSPDWCTGLSGQSLCRPDCSWVKHLELDLYPWDAGVRYGNTYIPKSSDRLDIPDPIAYINKRTMPQNPFTPNVPVAKVTIDRVLPKEDWQCTNDIGPNVKYFTSDGKVKTSMGPKDESMMMKKDKMMKDGKDSMMINDKMGKKSKKRLTPVVDSLSSLPVIPTKKRGGKKSGMFVQSAGTAGSGGLGQDNPLSDPALANMATFLCKTSEWSAWSPCSVTCGVGKKTRSRQMIVNKKNELCQHLPLEESDSCEGRKRTCDFSAMCSLLPWTDWSPCNATCTQPDNGQQFRKRYLARINEAAQCSHLFETEEERSQGVVIDHKACAPSAMSCDPVSICGEGRKDGVACGEPVEQFYYSAVEHSCLPFPFLGCKGGKNAFTSREACEQFCLAPVESLPAWRRERMVLLQYRTAQVSASSKDSWEDQLILDPFPFCENGMDSGVVCEKKDNSHLDETKNLQEVKWYYCKRTRRCREFLYNGCGGNGNVFQSYEDCLSGCMPQEVMRAERLAKAKMAAKKRKTSAVVQNDSSADELALINSSSSGGGEKQNCVMTKWGPWGPCSQKCKTHSGMKMRSRSILKPSRFGGQPCGSLFEKASCNGMYDC